MAQQTQKQNDTDWTDHLQESADEGMSDAREDRLNDDLDAFEADRAIQKEKKHRKTGTAVAVVIVLAAAGVITAGIVAATNSGTNYDTYRSSSTDKQVAGSYSSNPFTSFEMEGETIAMPTKVQDLQDAGWTISSVNSDEPLPEIISKDDYGVNINATRNGIRLFYISVENLSDSDEVPLNEAYITDYSFYSSRDNGLDLSMPYDVTFYESSDDVTAALKKEGAPYRIYYYDSEISSIHMDYQEENHTYDYEISFNNDGEVDGINLYYYSY